MERYNNLIDEIGYLFDDLSITDENGYSRDELNAIQELRDKLFAIYKTLIKHKTIYKNHKHKDDVQKIELFNEIMDKYTLKELEDRLR